MQYQSYMWDFHVDGYPVSVWATAISEEEARKRIITQITRAYISKDLVDSSFVVDRFAFAPYLCENGVLIPEVRKCLNQKPTAIRPAITGGFTISSDS